MREKKNSCPKKLGEGNLIQINTGKVVKNLVNKTVRSTKAEKKSDNFGSYLSLPFRHFGISPFRALNKPITNSVFYQSACLKHEIAATGLGSLRYQPNQVFIGWYGSNIPSGTG